MMKKLLCVLAAGWLCAGCVGQRARVDANNDYLPGPSLNQTYSILQSGDFSTLSDGQQTAILEEIDRQMQARGYQKVANSPDLSIVFTLYTKNCRLKESRWVGESVRGSLFSTQRTPLRNGTLLIQMVDEALNRSVWLGYASQLLRPHRTETLEDRELKAATRQIFDQYPQLAYGYVRSRE